MAARRSIRIIVSCAVAVLLVQPARAAAPEAVGRAAHDSYVAPINSNDLETFLAALADDVVLQAPGAPEIVGKAAVRDWAAGYLAAYRTRWEKRPIRFTVNGDGAFERYTYTATDTDRKTGVVTTDRGKGINIIRRDAAGRWRVAVDGWSSDTPPAP